MITINNTAIAGFIFDLDGTLVTSDIDFRKLQAELGCTAGGDVLAFANSHKDEAERERILSLIEAVELEDANQAALIDGALEFIKALQAQGLPIAIVTRNCRRAAERKIAHTGLPITPNQIITRADAPPKPDPTALLMLAEQWQLNPQNIAYVGDYHFDVDAALNADMHACLRLTSYSQGSDYAERAHYCFDHFDHFFAECFDEKKHDAY